MYCSISVWLPNVLYTHIGTTYGKVDYLINLIHRI